MPLSFSTALSALSAHATAVDVVGNNLANLNTPGFKASVVSFHDLVTQSLGAGLGETQVGFGVGRPVTIRNFSQGAIQTSTSALDAAIQGDGFLIVRDADSDAVLYTRGGNLQVDKQGNLLTSTSQRVQGWTESNGTLSTIGPVNDIVIPVGTSKAPIATTSLAVGGPFPQLAVSGLVNGAANLTLDWEMYNGQAPRLTQYTQPSAVSANAQDGSPAAQLIRVAVANGGAILAQYSNGQQTVVGVMAMAAIRNPESLIAVGDNNYQLSARTALPAIGVPGTGGRGSILGGAVENSTVDIAREFTTLIVLQRGYQANTRVVTAVDEISQETINLKR
jgi:flagellar hook protein FlgE